MATQKWKLFTLFIVSIILLQFVVEFCDARRSSRIIRTSRRTTTTRSRYSRTPMTRSTLRSKYGSSISSTRSKISSLGWKHALVAGGLLYLGSRMYMSRRMYYSHPHRKPTICSNYIDADENGTIFKMFICPRHYESDTLIHCCGSEGQQRCCAATKTTGGVVGIVIGVIITVAIIATVIYCICRNKQKQRGEVICKDGDGQEVIMGPMTPQHPAPMPMGYGPQPGMMPPPVMDPNQGYPYPVSPPEEPIPGVLPPPYAHPVPSAPGMPPGMAPGMPPSMPPGMPPGMPPSMPPGMPPSMPPGMPPQQPPPPGFYAQAPPHPPPPYAMP